MSLEERIHKIKSEIAKLNTGLIYSMGMSILVSDMLSLLESLEQPK